MTSVAFTVPGPVRGKGRPRTRVAGGHAIVYTDEKTRNYEGYVKDQAAAAMGGRPLLPGALAVRMTARFLPPKTTTKRKLAKMLGGFERPTGRPDMDNVAKILDSLNGVVFRDDSQVCSMVLDKVYAEMPGLDVTISVIDFAPLEDII